ncbi:MAG: thiamine pyrophosphate-binding protein [Chloroflexota bacterium]
MAHQDERLTDSAEETLVGSEEKIEENGMAQPNGHPTSENGASNEHEQAEALEDEQAIADAVQIAETAELHGGHLIGEVLYRHGVRHLFTLCGGHISPILIGAEQHGVRIIDVRHEATAVFAADGMARLSGIPGVAAVTAGPGLTNTITAVKNAQMAQSPLVLLGGATPTFLMGRGSLQDIDQKQLLKPHVKWMNQIRRVKDIVPALHEAFYRAQSGVPGPVFVELPIDVLYPESLIREWYTDAAPRGSGLVNQGIRWYLDRHVNSIFHDKNKHRPRPARLPYIPTPDLRETTKVRDALLRAERPVFVIGSGAMMQPRKAEALTTALKRLGVPIYLSGMARGLLGKDPLHIRHKRTKALKDADLVLLAGVTLDFRMQYGQVISGKAVYINVNRSRRDMNLNKRPTIGIPADPCDTILNLSNFWTESSDRWKEWHIKLLERNAARDAEIASQANASVDYCNPIQLLQKLEANIPDDSILIGDGGDFVATASYIVRPRAPLSWLDPGAFGTLGAGAGFALAAKLHRPSAEVWLIYGDGSAGYSLAEFDTFTRHNLSIIALVGTDGGWTQIARDQVDIFGTALGTELAYTPYHTVAEGYGGEGLLLQHDDDTEEALETAQNRSAAGHAVLINAWIGKTEFRKGSISM